MSAQYGAVDYRTMPQPPLPAGPPPPWTAQPQQLQIAAGKGKGKGQHRRDQRMRAGNPRNDETPDWLIPIHQDSIISYDRREATGKILGRLISTFNGMHVMQAWQNANQGLSRHNESRLAFDPPDGIYLSFWAMKTVQAYKCVIALSMDYPNGVACGQWNSQIAEVLAMSELQPIALPSMGLTGPTYFDMKILFVPRSGYVFKLDGMKVPEGLIAHIVTQGHMGDKNMSLDQNIWYPEAIDKFRRDQEKDDPKYEIRVVISVFRGFQVAVNVFSSSGRLIVLGRNAQVCLLGTPRVRLEIRVTPRDSPESLGHDADQIDLQ